MVYFDYISTMSQLSYDVINLPEHSLSETRKILTWLLMFLCQDGADQTVETFEVCRFCYLDIFNTLD